MKKLTPRRENILEGLFYIIISGGMLFKVILDSLLERDDNNGREKLLFFCLIFILIYIFYVIYKKVYKKIKIKNLDIQYIRQIPNYYSIPVVAFLYDKRINIKSLVMATILKLYDLELITILKENNNVIYEVNDFTNIDKISRSEKYILDWILDSNKRKYSHKQLSSIIINELENNQLIKNKNLLKIALIFSSTAIFPVLQWNGYISDEIYWYGLSLAFSIGILFIFIYPFIPTINKDYSKKGLREHYNVLGFYNFLKDFYILSKREMEEYILWKEYLQFAVLFGINKNYILKEELNVLTIDELLDCLEQIGARN